MILCLASAASAIRLGYPSNTRVTPVQHRPRPERIIWLPLLVLLVNLAVLGLLMGYSALNLWPDISTAHALQPQVYRQWTVGFAVLAPAVAALVLLWPALTWSRQRRTARAGNAMRHVPVAIAQRAANAPLALAACSLLGWMLVIGLAMVRFLTSLPDIALAVGVHLVLRPVLAGLIAGAATFFAAEYLCRTHVWPALLASLPIAGNPRLWRVRVSHRLLGLWLTISLLPLSAVALTTCTGVAGLDLALHPVLGRLVAVILLIAFSATVGGAWLAWLVVRSMGRPLEALEAAMARLRDGDFATREPVNTTDEIGALAEGFNLMAGRLAESHAALEARNRALAEALDRVLFLDIAGYTRLSEELPRQTLNAVVERYFSLFLAPIRAEGGDINETAGDGLMIIFQAGEPQAHAVSAVRAALAIRAQTTLANQDTRGLHPPILVNIGISSGECDVGITRFQGSAGERWTFTASGPVTNLAARLGTCASGGQILLSPDTAQRVHDRFLLRSLGLLALKNVSSPVEGWEVQGERHAMTEPARQGAT